ncbi:hypothetical protein OH807_37620 [Kitasatospora sp. NBC_01560]
MQPDRQVYSVITIDLLTRSREIDDDPRPSAEVVCDVTVPT